jgi:hypothetical protein
MNKKYLINNLGIGDLIFFCITILNNHKKGDLIEICLSKNTIKLFRDEQYEKFCYEYLNFFLDDFEVKILYDESTTNHTWVVDYNVVRDIILNNEIFTKIKNKFIIQHNKYGDYLVVFTKVRELDKKIYLNISEDFYEHLNKFDGKIILLGEQEILYSGEYAIHGENKIYTIYQDCISKIKKDKLIDLTMDKYEFNNFSIESIIKDISIISNSNKTFIFGGGGFFCLSLFTNKLVSLTNEKYKKSFSSENNQKIFSSPNEFKKYLTHN